MGLTPTHQTLQREVSDSEPLDFTTEMLAKFDIGSTVDVLDTVASFAPETALSAACVVL